jgi:hypothetical protein
MIVYPDNNNIAEKNWYIRAIIFGIYGIFLFFYSLREYLLTGHLLGRAFCHCERKRGSPANLGDFIRSEVD